MGERAYNNRKNVFAFLKENGHKSYEEQPICFGDYLVFGLLCYLNVEECPKFINKKWGPREFIRLEDIDLNDGTDYAKHYFMHKTFVLFLSQVFAAERYKELKICYVKTLKQRKPVCWLGMMTFIADGKPFIMYRGTEQATDAWDEDLRTISLNELPSEKHAIEYLKKSVKRYRGKEITIIGHSKGGYLSFMSYSALTKAEKRLVTKVISFDGECSPFVEKNYRDKKMKKFVPQVCVVGMLFERTKKYKVVKSQRHGPEGHCLFSWILDKKKNFTRAITAHDVSLSSEMTRFLSIDFFNKSTLEDNKRFGKFLMSIAYLNESGSLLSITSDIMRHPKKYIDAIKASSHKEKEDFMLVMHRLIQAEVELLMHFPEIYSYYFPNDKVPHSGLISLIAFKIEQNYDKNHPDKLLELNIGKEYNKD